MQLFAVFRFVCFYTLVEDNQSKRILFVISAEYSYYILVLTHKLDYIIRN